MTHVFASNLTASANQFNPTVFSPTWLKEHDVIATESEPPLFTPGVVNVKSDSFQLVVIPPQLQFHLPPAESADKQLGTIDAKFTKLIGLVPHTPFTSVAANIQFHYSLAGKDISKVTQSLFSSDGMAAWKVFENAAAIPCLSVTYPEQDYEVRFHSNVFDHGEGKKCLALAFSYFRDVSERPDKSSLITTHALKWKSFVAAAQQRVNAITAVLS